MPSGPVTYTFVNATGKVLLFITVRVTVFCWYVWTTAVADTVRVWKLKLGTAFPSETAYTLRQISVTPGVPQCIPDWSMKFDAEAAGMLTVTVAEDDSSSCPTSTQTGAPVPRESSPRK